MNLSLTSSKMAAMTSHANEDFHNLIPTKFSANFIDIHWLRDNGKMTGVYVHISSPLYTNS